MQSNYNRGIVSVKHIFSSIDRKIAAFKTGF